LQKCASEEDWRKYKEIICLKVQAVPDAGIVAQSKCWAAAISLSKVEEFHKWQLKAYNQAVEARRKLREMCALPPPPGCTFPAADGHMHAPNVDGCPFVAGRGW
jgi:hypothetical protein